MIKYKYLKRKTFFILLIAILLVSSIFSFTIEGLILFINAGLGYFGSGNVIYDTKSRTIFTGSINLVEIKNLLVSENIELAPEVIIPVYINDKYLLCRGIDFSILQKYNIYNIKVTKGRLPNYNNEVIIGHKAAERINIDVNDVIIIKSIIRDVYVIAIVSGIFYSDSPLDYELLATLELAQYLRGFDRNHVTLVRVFQSKGVEIGVGKVNEALQGQDIKKLAHQINETLKIKAAIISNEKIFSIYMKKFGFSGYSILMIAVLTLMLILSGLYYITNAFIEENIDIIYQLYMIGARIKSIKMDILIKLTPYIILFTVVSYYISHKILLYIWSIIDIQYILHIYDIGINLFSLALTIFLILTVFMVSVIRGVKQS